MATYFKNDDGEYIKDGTYMRDDDCCCEEEETTDITCDTTVFTFPNTLTVDYGTFAGAGDCAGASGVKVVHLFNLFISGGVTVIAQYERCFSDDEVDCDILNSGRWFATIFVPCEEADATVDAQVVTNGGGTRGRRNTTVTWTTSFVGVSETLCTDSSTVGACATEPACFQVDD